MRKLSSFSTPVRLAKNGAPGLAFTGVSNGLVSVDSRRQLLYFLGYNSNDNVTNNDPPTTFVAYDPNRNTFTSPTAVVNPASNSFVGCPASPVFVP